MADERRGAVRGALFTLRARFRSLAATGDRPDRSRGRRPLGVDSVVAFDIALTALVFALGYRELEQANRALGPPDDFPRATLVFLMFTLTAPLLLRDRGPRLAWIFSMLSTAWTIGAALTITGTPYVSATVVVPLYCLYTVAARYGRRTTVISWAISLGLGAALAPAGILLVAALVTTPVLVGMNVRSRRLAQRELREREERHQEERAVLEERQRISRELHDVVAHHMSVIAIHAEAAPYKMADPPPELTESLADIRANALAGLTELRRILGVLRTGDTAQTAPQPALDRLDEIVASARAGGLLVESSISGAEGRAVPQSVGLSAYRIVQEALSNVMKHAPGASVSIEIACHPQALNLRVVNGPGSGVTMGVSATGGGHGLVGMRERAAALGGELAVGPTSGGGFAVAAVLPLGDEATEKESHDDSGDDRR